MRKAIVYYTDSRLEEDLDLAVRKQIIKAADGIPIISVSQVPLDFGANICVGRKPRSYISLYEQLFIGLEVLKKDTLVYLCEHDVFYPEGYFKYEPEDDYGIYFNLHRFFFMRGLDTFYPSVGKRALSQAVSKKEVLIDHVEDQLRKRRSGQVSFVHGPFFNWFSENPTVDIKHGGNFSDDSKGRGSYLSGEIKGIKKIWFWETTEHFQEIVGYKNLKFGTVDYLKNRFSNATNKNHNIIEGFFRDDIASLFCELGMVKGAEIGVKKGFFSAVLCMLNPSLRLKCIDPWNPYGNVGWDMAETLFVHAKNNLSSFNVDIIRKTSMQAADETPKESLDFVYIDADHSFNAVMQDIIVWSDRVRRGGIVSGHDYDNPDVQTAVEAYIKIHGYQLFVTEKGSQYPDSAPSWFFAKRDL